MKPRWSLLLLLLAMLIRIPPLEAADPPELTARELTARERDYEQLAVEAEWFERQGRLLRTLIHLANPTVVHIEAIKTPLGAGYVRQTVEEAGSGIILLHREQYFVLTNRHVVRDASLDQIRIRFADGRETRPLRLMSDPGSDLAVMKIPASTQLTPARLGDSGQLRIGDFVVAIGSPFGLSHSVTFGIVSAKGRRDLDLGDERVRFQDFIQTDAAINPGNSGGPLLNLRGEVVGINTAIASASGHNEGIGFAIPINMVRFIAQQLVDRGRVSRAYLGVKLDRSFDQQAAQRLGLPGRQGALVNGVTPKSPAESAGLQLGDLVLVFDGVAIEDDAHLVNQVSVTPIGSRVEIEVLRNGSRVQLQLELTDRSQFEADG